MVLLFESYVIMNHELQKYPNITWYNEYNKDTNMKDHSYTNMQEQSKSHTNLYQHHMNNKTVWK